MPILLALAIGFGSGLFGKWFRYYSYTTILAMLVFGLLMGLQASAMTANGPTPWMGLRSASRLIPRCSGSWCWLLACCAPTVLPCDNQLVGLVNPNLLLVVGNLLGIPITLAFYVLLRREATNHGVTNRVFSALLRRIHQLVRAIDQLHPPRPSGS